MSDSSNKSGRRADEFSLDQRRSDLDRQRTFREKWEENWLARLRTLPEPAYRECVRRLQEGAPAISVSRWLLTLPNRGGLQGITNLHTMRKYLEVLRARVRAARKKVPLPAVTAKQLKKMVAQEHRRVDNAIALEGGPINRKPEPTAAPPDSPAEREPDNVIAMEGKPMKSEVSPTPPPARDEDRAVRQNQSMIQVARNAQASNPRIWLKAVAEINWERMRLSRLMEEKIKMPLAVTNAISNVIIKAAEADRRAELAEIAKQKQLGTNPEEDFDPISINGIPLNDAERAKELPADLQEMKKHVDAMTVEDRMLAGTVLGGIRNIMKMKLQLKAEQAAAQKPDTPSEEEKAR